MKNKQINIASDFSPYPAGRFVSDGPFSGEVFRNEHLVPALNDYEKVTVNISGVPGYGSSFLEEAFGGLIRECGFSAQQLKEKLEIIYDSNESLEEDKKAIWEYISDAETASK
jgi:hypothetical protein